MITQFTEDLFVDGNAVIIAHQVECGMIIALSENQYFYVDDIDVEFINDEVSKLYAHGYTDNDILPEHSKFTFYNEDDDEICDVPGTARIIAYTRIVGEY